MTSDTLFIGQNYIDGAWRDGDAPFETFNPSDLDEQVGRYSKASPDDIEQAMDAAQRALPAWRSFNMQARADLLRKVGDLLIERSASIGRILAREEGKTLADATGEAIRAAQCFHFYAGEVLRNPGQWHDSMRDGHNIIVSHEPVGVVAAITPWNFPIALPAWKLAAALAYGNSVVLKPSSFVPAAAIMLVRLLEEVGVPKGVVNLVMGEGRIAGNIMIDRADALTFTGGTETGRAVLQRAALSMTKVQLELGGKNPLIVLDDADMDLAVSIAANGAWIQTGQRCTGTERFIVAEKVHDEFVERVAKEALSYRVGHALDADTQIGPVATAPQFRANLDFIAKAKDEGAELIAGGSEVECRTRGLYLAPTLFANTRNYMQLNRHESFGPIASVIKVADLDEAIAVANDCDFALSAGIATQNLRAAEQFRRNSKAGMVMVNAPTAGLEYHVPLGGRAPSGFGPRETGTASAAFFTEMKTAYIHHGVI